MVILWIHWVSGAAFIGGMASYIWVYQGVPLPAGSEDMLRWRRRIETRFRSYRWSCLLLLLGTGVLNLVNGGVAAKISSSFGAWLLIKLLLVAGLFSLSGVYDFLLRERKKDGGKKSVLPTPLDSPLRNGIGYAILGTAVGIFIIAGLM